MAFKQIHDQAKDYYKPFTSLRSIDLLSRLISLHYSSQNFKTGCSKLQIGCILLLKIKSNQAHITLTLPPFLMAAFSD